MRLSAPPAAAPSFLDRAPIHIHQSTFVVLPAGTNVTGADYTAPANRRAFIEWVHVNLIIDATLGPTQAK